ncbi:MAG: glycosyltransferase family 39 protein, partial [Chloroflexota bacterium]|nr:glycosyltransferase family 39 protein [Chloroflexota bacterium]
MMALLLLLLLWWTRITALDTLPLHNDEGLHLTRAVEVWNLNPFWEIRDGKIINHWLIAAFYPQNQPVFIGRVASVFVAMIGLAAALALARRARGRWTMLLTGLLWISAPLLFFYERMAFSDAQAGALGTLALLASLYLTRSQRSRDALLTGAALALALLFKFTAAPFAVSVGLVYLTPPQSQVTSTRSPLQKRRDDSHLPSRRSQADRTAPPLFWREGWGVMLRNLLIIAAAVAAAFAVPIAVLVLRGGSLFDIALAWVGTGGSGDLTLLDNLGRLLSLLVWADAPLFSLILSAGLLAVLIYGRREGRVLLLAAAIPLLVIMTLGRDAQSRHFVAALPPLIAVAGIGLGLAVEAFPAGVRLTAAAALAIALFAPFQPLALHLYRDPATVALPALMRQQYIVGYASGYGLREAVQAFPQTIARPDIPIIGSMYPDSCRRANFHAPPSMTLVCGDAPMRAA